MHTFTLYQSVDLSTEQIWLNHIMGCSKRENCGALLKSVMLFSMQTVKAWVPIDSCLNKRIVYTPDGRFKLFKKNLTKLHPCKYYSA